MGAPPPPKSGRPWRRASTGSLGSVMEEWFQRLEQPAVGGMFRPSPLTIVLTCHGLIALLSHRFVLPPG